MYKRLIFNYLKNRLEEPRKFLQVLLGPRQVGKTTLALQLKESLEIPSLYISADTATLEDLVWLETEWEVARQKIKKKVFLLLMKFKKYLIGPAWLKNFGMKIQEINVI